MSNILRVDYSVFAVAKRETDCAKANYKEMKNSNFTLKLSVVSVALCGLVLSSCKKNEQDFDASGTFETTEVLVSAESTGRILTLNIEEGSVVEANQPLGLVDSTQLYLKRLQLEASRRALKSRTPDVRKQVAALDQQIITARVEQKRIEKLVQANAATSKQLDDVKGQIAVLEKQLVAALSTLETTNNGIMNDNDALGIQLRQLDDQLAKCRLISPITGTVLAKYAEAGELAVAGKPLFKVGDTKNMVLRAFITSDQLTLLKLGQKVRVFADSGTEMKEYAGRLEWVSDKAEFTPKTIQTRDERANLVYAVKISVQNDGFLKIGMYGNVRFN